MCVISGEVLTERGMRAFDLSTGRPVFKPEPTPGKAIEFFESVRFSRDGKTLAGGYVNPTQPAGNELGCNRARQNANR